MKSRSPAFWLMVGLVLSWSVVATGAAAASPVSAEEVLGRAIQARGGREAALNIHSFQVKGTVFFYTSRGPWYAAGITNVCPLEILAMRPDKFRFVTDLSSTRDASSMFVPPRYYENGFDGQTAWEAPPGSPPQALEGILREERREQAEFFSWCAGPANCRSVTNLGETDFEGRRCYELRLVRKSGKEETHYYNVTNCLLAGIVRSSVFGPSLERFVFDDYREIGGFKFPTGIRYQADDERDQAHLRSIERLASIEVNGVTGSAFKMPAETRHLEIPRLSLAREVAAAEVQTMLHDWIDTDKLADGIVVGLLDEQACRVVGRGKVENKEVDGDTVFGLASISKVFTRLLLLDMVQRGDLRLDDPAQRYLPASVRLPTRNGKEITLLHLATHTSGLPRYIPGSEEQVYARLTECMLDRDPGEQYEYSNIGMGLLGKAIERKAGKPYQELVAERICRPLGMDHTSVMNCRFPGIDGVQSSANDLAKFAAACLGLTPAPSPLAPLMRHEYATHGGSGGDAHSYLVVDPIGRRALVTLAVSADDNYGAVQMTLNRLILNQSPEPLRIANVESGLYDRYAGQYLSADNSVWMVRRQGSRLLLQKSRGPSCEVFPVSETNFVNELTGLAAAFAPQSPGKPRHLMLHELDSNWTWQGNRFSDQTPVRSLTVRLASEIAEDCAGQYKDPAGNITIIRRDGDQFTAEVRAPNPADMVVEQLVSESESSFTSLNSPAALTFLRNSSGKVSNLIRHVYASHIRYDKIAPAPPPLAEADAARFLGIWQARVAIDERTEIRALMKVSRTNGSYRATLDVAEKGITNEPLQTLVFLSKTSIFLGSPSGNHWANFRATLNDAETELSGTWKEGQAALPVTFKRNTGQPLEAAKSK